MWCITEINGALNLNQTNNNIKKVIFLTITLFCIQKHALDWNERIKHILMFLSLNFKLPFIENVCFPFSFSLSIIFSLL